jgi:hypothetical protein
MTRLAARRGALLPMVLVVMVIIALSACAALFTARLERRASWNARLEADALGAADRAHAEMLPAFARVAHTLLDGTSMTRVAPAATGVSTTTRLTRLGPTLFLFAADAGAESPQGWSARRRASVVLRLEPPSLTFPAALNFVGTPGPSTPVADGVDHLPNGWPCGVPRSDTASTGHPSPTPDSSVLADLRTRAAITLPAGTALRGVQPVVRATACATDRPDNWGDPDRAGACSTWLPIVHAAGDLAVDGGAGQGVLLVDGDLAIGGGFRFTGAVIVAGTVDIGAGGASLVGGVIARDATDRSGSAGTDPVVIRSSCAVSAALLAAGALVPVADRAWSAVR